MKDDMGETQSNAPAGPGRRSPGGGGRASEYVRRIRAEGPAAGDGLRVRAPRKLYRVSEIAGHLGITRQTVHNYATIGLITEEARTGGGQRLFDESVFGRLALVRQMKRTHRLHEIRRILDGRQPPAPPPETPAAVAPHAGAAGAAVVPTRAEARGLLERMQELAAAAHLREPPADRESKHVIQESSSSTDAVVGNDAGPDFAFRAPPDQPTPGHEKEAPADEDRPT
jgi:DNA-binding transcriptional MerR regulator